MRVVTQMDLYIAADLSEWCEIVSDPSSSADPMTYEDDPTDDLQILTFDDLLSFAFQVAKGMEFLSSKNVINKELWKRYIYISTLTLLKGQNWFDN